MDVDAVVAEVASAVGLAEGQSGVRDILRAIARRARAHFLANIEHRRFIALPFADDNGAIDG